LHYHEYVVTLVRLKNETMNTIMTNTETAGPIGLTQTCADETGQALAKTISPKQLEANRRNAQKSTGPLTRSGRAVCRMNALKHGIFSKEVLVAGGNFKEDSQALSALHERFWLDLNPVGPVEEMLVDQIVTTHWRLRRALKAESGEIALSVGGIQRKRNASTDALALSWCSSPDPISALEESVDGLCVLQFMLDQLRAGVEREGELTQASIQALVQKLGGQSNRLTSRMEQARSRFNENPDGLTGDALRERKMARTLAFLNEEGRKVELKRRTIEKQEASEEEARRAAAVLPARPVVEKILYYQEKLERQLSRAMADLERLQRRRQGERIPPPLTVEVTA
jgi:hypothetical protein